MKAKKKVVSVPRLVKAPCVDPLVHTAAREVARDLRTLADSFGDGSPGFGEVLRGFARRLDP